MEYPSLVDLDSRIKGSDREAKIESLLNFHRYISIVICKACLRMISNQLMRGLVNWQSIGCKSIDGANGSSNKYRVLILKTLDQCQDYLVQLKQPKTVVDKIKFVITSNDHV